MNINEVWDSPDLDAEGLTCGGDEPYHYWLRSNSSDKLLIFFQGGGYCDTGPECDQYADRHFQPFRQNDIDASGGIFSVDARNPFRKYTQVFLPYCTGDFHWGSKTHDYGTTTVNHHGYINAQAALNDVFQKVTNPKLVLVTGSSAGGFGALMHFPAIKQHYSGSQIALLTDCAAGIIPDTSLWPDLQTKYDYMDKWPSWMPPFVTTPFKLMKIYMALAAKYQDVAVAQFNFANDLTQATAYVNVGGAPNIVYFPIDLLASLNAIHSKVDNFHSYTVAGPHKKTNHCILRSNKIINISATTPTGTTVQLLEWIREVAETPGAPMHVKRVTG